MVGLSHASLSVAENGALLPLSGCAHGASRLARGPGGGPGGGGGGRARTRAHHIAHVGAIRATRARHLQNVCFRPCVFNKFSHFWYHCC